MESAHLDIEDPRARRTLMRRGLKVVRSYVVEHPVPFVTAVAGAATFAGATVATAFVLGWITDEVIVPAFREGVTPARIGWGVAALAGVGLVRAGGIVVRRFFAGMAAARMQATLRTRVLERYRDLPLSFHRSRTAGEMLSHVESDVVAATDVMHPLPFSTAAVMLVAATLIALVVTDPMLTAVGLAILPLLTLFNRIFGDRMEAPAANVQERAADVAGVVHESFDGALIVKTLGRERDETARLAAVADSLMAERIRLGRLRATFDPLFEALPHIGVIALLAVGSWRVATGDVSVGTVVRFVSLFQLIAFPTRLIGWVLADLPRSVVGRERLERVLTDRRSDPVGDGRRLPDRALDVVVADVNLSYDGYRILRGISFSVAPGETVALVGPTASGRSSLVSMLAGLAVPDSGTVEIGGVDPATAGPDVLSRGIALVFQESFVFRDTIRENITLGRSFTDDELRRAARLAQAEAFIEALPEGFDTIVGERGVTLSGGQRQRIALARALIRAPRLLILDDATSAIDPVIEGEILRALAEQKDMTKLVIAHRGATIAWADRVLFIDGGRVVDEGSHEELMRNPDYERMLKAYQVGAA